MITLNEAHETGPQLHRVTVDPGRAWAKDTKWVIDAASDHDIRPDPTATWLAAAPRSGICGAVSPRVIGLVGGGYRLYYTQLLPRPGFPAGAVDYDQASSRVLSAHSADGETWTLDEGVRLSSEEGGAGEFRVVSSEVVPIPHTPGHLRMYYECCPGPQSGASTILSARSEDGGLQWTREPGVRWGNGQTNYAAPRIQFLDESLLRLYCYQRGGGIISLISYDGGTTFDQEPGMRLVQAGPRDGHAAFAPEIMQINDGEFVMYYAGYASLDRSHILRATSTDGFLWRKDGPVISPGPKGWDAVKCSEMSLMALPRDASGGTRFRLLYEACDGTSAGQRGVWRIASASTSLMKGSSQ